MNTAEVFQEFIDNLSIDNKEQISNRYGEITCCLNRKYRDTDSKTANSLQVGSYGRNTAIKGVSDLDMIYIMPKSEWSRFKDGRQSALLQEIKNTLLERYPKTTMKGDGQVVVVSFDNQEVEIVPAFEQEDGSFLYPDTHNGGSWLITNPRAEIQSLIEMDNKKNNNLRRLCKMIRAWKNKHGIVMGGLLIDTLAYNFLNSTDEFNDRSYLYYDWLVRDFFKFLSELNEQEYYLAPGSRQYVYVKNKFQNKAKKAYELCLEAIEAEDQVNANTKWKKIFGRPFPANSEVNNSALETQSSSWDDTEEHIEDKHIIDIRYPLVIDCDVLQKGFREDSLSNMLKKRIPLLAQKNLMFKIIQNDVPAPFDIKWKVLNRGEIAKKRNQIRGQIVEGATEKKEVTSFRGEHIVECYVLKNNIVVARDEIDVPIKNGE